MLDGLSVWILKSSRIMTGSDSDKHSEPGMKISRESVDVLCRVVSDSREEAPWAVECGVKGTDGSLGPLRKAQP